MTVLDWVLLGFTALLAAGLALWLTRRSREVIRSWFRRQVLQAVHRFRVRIERYKLVSRRVIRDELLLDRHVHDAMRDWCRANGASELDARVRVERYIDEIVPFFNVLSYYKVGYNIARGLINLLYRPGVAHEDRAALERLPKNDVVLYLMNHRSNADYVVVAYILAQGVSISYAVGEWARTWPLEYIFKSFGSYFIRRRFREPLYHTVLERYVQLITRHGVTQGIFLEGGLSRDGALRPAKIGLLDYVARTLLDAEFDRDIWLVPVALNYDRVLEDRSLIRELVDASSRPGRWRQLTGVVHYVGWNLGRLLTGNLRRYGRVAVTFGTPISLSRWVAERPGVLELPKADRLPRMQELADAVLDRVAAIIPVTPVPLCCAALLSFGETMVGHNDLMGRLDIYLQHLRDRNAKLGQADYSAKDVWDRAWRTFRMRRLVVREGGGFIILPSHRPLLEYYANSVRHLLPKGIHVPEAHPARDRDGSLPRLKRWEPRSPPHPPGS